MAYSYINLNDVKNFNLTKIGVNSAQEFVRDNIVSFRSSKGYQEVAGIAEALNGGGHQYSSAARITASEGDQAAKLILDTINRVQNTNTIPVNPQSSPSPTPLPST